VLIDELQLRFKPLVSILAHAHTAMVAEMKTVLFCGGLGTRIRDVSENIPKPMVPVGDKPILWHLMHYYSQFGRKDFVLCLGYKANVIKEYFLNYKPQTYADCVVSGFGNEVEILGDPQQDLAHCD
jgi:glucose-1-phosphate cytidylyltransferase